MDGYTTPNPPSRKVSVSQSPDSGGKLTQILSRLENLKIGPDRARLVPMPTSNKTQGLPPIRKMEDFFHIENQLPGNEIPPEKLGGPDGLGSLQDLLGKVGPNNRNSLANNNHNRTMSEQRPGGKFYATGDTSKGQQNIFKQPSITDANLNVGEINERGLLRNYGYNTRVDNGDGYAGSVPRRVVDAVGEIDKRNVYQDYGKGLSSRGIVEVRNSQRGNIGAKKRFSMYGDMNINNTINITNNVINNHEGR